MRFARLVLLALLALAAASPLTARDPDIVVEGGIHRAEIERILAEDNVDTSRLSERQVADSIDQVKRGRAPKDFWLAYRAHVLAWKRLAEAVERAARSGSPFGSEDRAKADRAIEATFDEVERIARSYGARLPTPPWAAAPTV